MNSSFILSCESTADLPYSYMNGRNVSVLFYTYCIDGREYTDDMKRNANASAQFYKLLESGKMPKTSQINEYRYEEYFEELLKKGDVLHISFGSGMTPSVKNAERAAETVRERFPERKITVIDSLCSCAGYGLLVDMVADMRDSGKTLEETAEYTESIKGKIQHQFFSTDLKYFRRSGRVSGPAAAVASVLGICPIMHLDENGKIVAYDKVRGVKNAVQRTVSEVIENADNNKNYNGKFFIAHSNCEDLAKQTAEQIEKNIKGLKGKIKIFDIGMIIASHCGPGTVAAFFVGSQK